MKNVDAVDCLFQTAYFAVIEAAEAAEEVLSRHDGLSILEAVSLEETLALCNKIIALIDEGD